MSDTTIWVVFLIGGVITFLLRWAFIVGWGRLYLPKGVRRALRFVPIAVLIAIIVPDTLLQNGQLALTIDNYRLIAALVAVGVAAVTRNILLTIGVGFVTLLVLMNIGSVLPMSPWG